MLIPYLVIVCFSPTYPSKLNLEWQCFLIFLLCPLADRPSYHLYIDCESFARRTFTTPKIQTFTTPKFGHFPPPKKNICQEDNCHPQFIFLFLAHFSWLFRLTAHGGHQGWEGGGA